MSNEAAQKKSSFVEIYKQSFTMLKENPTILIMFLFIALLDAIALTIVFLSPSEPVLSFLGPIIKTFYSEKFLHYPANFILLPKLFMHAHFLILAVFGLLITGIVIKKIDAYVAGTKMTSSAAIGPVFKKYLSMLTVWLLSYFCFRQLSAVLMPLLGQSFAIQVASVYLIAIVVQALFAFLMPAIILGSRGFIKETITAFGLSFKHLFLLILLVALPVLFIVALSILKSMAPVFLNIKPEIVLWILALSITVSMIADVFITSATTLYYLKVRQTS